MELGKTVTEKRAKYYTHQLTAYLEKERLSKKRFNMQEFYLISLKSCTCTLRCIKKAFSSSFRSITKTPFLPLGAELKMINLLRD